MNTLGPRTGTVQFLASVRSVSEAQAALDGGAEIIDCKDPATGALGALAPDELAKICELVAGRVPVSATVGDDAVASGDAIARVQGIAKAGADFVKIGLEGRAPWQDALNALGRLQAPRPHLVAVLLADQGFDLAMVRACRAAGFVGMLLDTHDKSQGSLPEIVSQSELEAFITTCRNHRMFAGLAGALRMEHIQPLIKLRPDVLGFRGALCDGGGRTQALCCERVAEIRVLIARFDASHETRRTQIAKNDA